MDPTTAFFNMMAEWIKFQSLLLSSLPEGQERTTRAVEIDTRLQELQAKFDRVWNVFHKDKADKQ